MPVHSGVGGGFTSLGCFQSGGPALSDGPVGWWDGALCRKGCQGANRGHGGRRTARRPQETRRRRGARSEARERRKTRSRCEEARAGIGGRGSVAGPSLTPLWAAPPPPRLPPAGLGRPQPWGGGRWAVVGVVEVGVGAEGEDAGASDLAVLPLAPVLGPVRQRDRPLPLLLPVQPLPLVPRPAGTAPWGLGCLLAAREGGGGFTMKRGFASKTVSPGKKTSARADIVFPGPAITSKS